MAKITAQRVAQGMPDAHELEISVFGCGFGEAIAIHVGNEEWILVDSFLNSTNVPIAIEYLRSIAVPFANVVQVVCTHWHDDHARGISKALELCPKASFVCSAALRNKEFRETVRSISGIEAIVVGSGVDEIERSWRLLNQRSQKPKWAIADRVLFERPAVGSTPAVRVTVLTPTDEDFSDAILDLAREVSKAKSVRALPTVSPNEIAVAIHVEFGARSVVLGSDVESRTWQVVASGYKKSRAQMVKVPHHGGKSAHHDEFWTRVADKAPAAIVTEFRRGSVALPTTEDLSRLRSLSASLDRTSDRALIKHAYSGTLGRILGRISGLKIWMRPETGHVRMRCSANSAPQVEHFGAAKRVH